MEKIIILTIICVGIVKGYEDGCPAYQCVTGYPRHENAVAMTTSSGATITLSQSNYSPTGSIIVTLTGDFEGFVLRAFRAPSAVDTEEIVGEFIAPFPTGAKAMSWMQQSGVYNCMTHADEDDFTSLAFTWKASSTSVGDVIFKATVLQDFEKFWVNVASSILVANTPGPVESTTSVVNPDFSDYTFADACGTSKGCLMYPSGCKGDSCEVVVSYQSINSGADIKFEMSAIMDTGYFSVGFSADGFMGEELTVNCMRSGTTLYVEHASNRNDYFNVRQRITDLRDIHIKSNNGRLYCSFTRDTSLTYFESGTTNSKTSNLNNKVILFVAKGDVFADSEVIQKHGVFPLVSSGKINLLETKISTGRTTPLTLSIHVMFGLLGYFVLMGFPILVARHFRKELSKPICGVAFWFQLHRGSIGAMFILGILAIILGLITALGWNLNAIATAHGIFGILATVMMLVNIIMGIKRPGLDAPKRPMYNMAHRICGILAYVFVVICLLLGTNVDLLHPKLRLNDTIIVAVGLFIQILLEVVLEILRCKPASKKNDSYNMDENKDKAEPTEDGCNKKAKLAILILYVIVVLILAIAAIVMAFIY